MASLYTRKANRIRIAKQAIEKLMVWTHLEGADVHTQSEVRTPKNKKAISQ
jgi:hypothetical protein